MQRFRCLTRREFLKLISLAPVGIYSRPIAKLAGVSQDAARDLDAVVAFAQAVERSGGSTDPSVVAFVDLLDAGEGGPGVSGTGDPDADAVQVRTAHGAAGIEFDTVVLVGAVEGDFPSLARPEPMFDLAVLEGEPTRSELMRHRLADERRLFRSVLGRARRGVLLTASEPRGGQDGARSRFVDELGIPWSPMVATPAQPVSLGEAAATWRRTLADRSVAMPERLAAIDGLLALGVDPRRWWFQRDWTDTGRPLHETLRLSFSRLDTLENCELQFVLGRSSASRSAAAIRPGSGSSCTSSWTQRPQQPAQRPEPG